MIHRVTTAHQHSILGLGKICVMKSCRQGIVDKEPVQTRLVIAHEAEEYANSIPGLGIKVLRTGVGLGPNVTRIASFGDVAITSGFIQFPMLGTATVGENKTLVNVVTSAPLGSRWCGIDLKPGTVMLYGPGALHTGNTPVDFGFSFVALDIDAIKETADRLEVTLGLPERGHVRTLDPTPRVRFLSQIVRDGSDALRAGRVQKTLRLDALHAAASALSMEPPAHEAGKGAKIDDRSVVSTCIEYADATGRIPTIAEMCLVAHVSERRLRYSFINTFRQPPSRFFRYRSLAIARQRLMVDREREQSISRIATDVGFNNFGRFARAYRATYGELPSATLATHRGAPTSLGRGRA